MDLVKLVLQNHLGSILVAVIFGLMWWRHGEKVLAFLAKLEKWYDRVRKVAEEKKFYELAQKAYGHVNELCRKTETKVDDKVAEGLAWMLKAMKHAGLESNGDTEDVIKGYFNQIRDAEEKAKELNKLVPFGKKDPETPEGSGNGS